MQLWCLFKNIDDDSKIISDKIIDGANSGPISSNNKNVRYEINCILHIVFLVNLLLFIIYLFVFTT